MRAPISILVSQMVSSACLVRVFLQLFVRLEEETTLIMLLRTLHVFLNSYLVNHFISVF